MTASTQSLAQGTTTLSIAKTSLMGKAGGILVAGAQCENLELLEAASLLIEQALVMINSDAPISPETALSRQFQLSVVDKTKTVDGVVTGIIEVQYVIPANMDHPRARAEVIKTCEARGDRSRPAIWSGDLEWYKKQASEKGDNPAIERVVKYTIDFDSKDSGDGKMDMAGHRAYAQERDAHITPVELQALGAALYYEKTGLDLMKNCWVRAVVSRDGSAPGVALATLPSRGVDVRRPRDGLALAFLVAALSPN